MPIVRGLEREYAGRIDFKLVNILLPESAVLMDEFSFGTTPELYLVDSDRQVVGFWDEIDSADDLRLVFDEAAGE